jgi:hypothetical protein
MPELSPAAQAVLDAAFDPWQSTDTPVSIAAAVLRAAADQVAPLGYEDVWTDGRILQYEKRDPVREKLLAIAEELEAIDEKLEERSPISVKEQCPDRLAIGDIWEFETEVKVKGKRKLQAVTLQYEVKRFHHGECAWQLQSLDGQHYVYLWEHAPQYEEMTYIGTKKSD